MNAARWTTLAGVALVLGAVVALVALGDGAMAERVLTLVVGALGGGLVKHGGVGFKAPKGSENPTVALLLLAPFLSLCVLEQGCNLTQVERDRIGSMATRLSTGLLKAAPGLLRLSDKPWAEPAATTLAAWTPALITAAEAARDRCVDPAPLVAQVLGAIAATIAQYVDTGEAVYDVGYGTCSDGETVADAMDILTPLVEEAVGTLWPYPVGACPYATDAEPAELDVPERFDVFGVDLVEVGPIVDS